jgi:hypothetical protein
MRVGATARGLTHGFDDHVPQPEAEDAEDGVQHPEKYGVVGQEPGNILRQHTVNGFTVTDHGSPVVIRCSKQNRVHAVLHSQPLPESAFEMYFFTVYTVFCG